MSHLLFVHATYLAKIKAYEVARRCGHRISVAGPELPGWAAPYVARHIAVDTFPELALKEALVELGRWHARDPFDGVVTFWDHGVVPAAHIAEALGLPGGGAASACSARNKARMREVLAAHGVPGAAAARVTGWDELVAAAGRIGYPAIYKSTGGAGSAGIFRVDSADGLRAAYELGQDYANPDSDSFFGYFPGEFVYEEFLVGCEVSVEGVVSGGEVEVSGVTDKVVDPENYFTEYQNSFPAEIDDDARREAVDVAVRAVTAIGLDGCGFHVEVMLTAAGGKVVEVNARLGGGFIASHLVPLAGGDELIEAALDAAVGARVRLGRPPTGGACNRYLIAERPGTVLAWDGVEAARSSPGVVELGIMKQVGDRVVRPPDSFFDQAVAHVITRGDTTAQANARAEQALELLRCTVG